MAMITMPLCILSNFTVAEVNCQGVVGLIVTSIIVTVALRDYIIKCSQAVDLRVEGTGGGGTSPSPGGETGVLPVTAIVTGKFQPGKQQSTQNRVANGRGLLTHCH